MRLFGLSLSRLTCFFVRPFVSRFLNVYWTYVRIHFDFPLMWMLVWRPWPNTPFESKYYTLKINGKIESSLCDDGWHKNSKWTDRQMEMARKCACSLAIASSLETWKRKWTMEKITEAILRVNNHHLPFIINHFIVFASFSRSLCGRQSERAIWSCFCVALQAPCSVARAHATYNFQLRDSKLGNYLSLCARKTNQRCATMSIWFTRELK